MSVRQVEIRISPDGSKVKVEGKGFVGEGCTEVTRKFLAEAGSIESQELKPSFYDTETEQVSEDLE